MILARLWFPLFYVDGGKAGEDTAGAGRSSKGSPWHQGLHSQDLQEHKDSRALTPHGSHPWEERQEGEQGSSPGP